MPQGSGPHDAPTLNRERRDAQRVEILGALRADVLVAQPLLITDISDLGLQVVSDFPFQLNTLHEFKLRLGPQSVVLKGRIVHSSVVDLDGGAARYRTGIALEEVPPNVRTVIGEYARQLQALRAGD